MSDDRTVCESKDKLKECLERGEKKATTNAKLIKRANRYQAKLNEQSEIPGSRKQHMKRFIKQVKTKSEPMPPKDCGKTIGSKQYLIGDKRPLKTDSISPVRITSKSLTPTPHQNQNNPKQPPNQNHPTPKAHPNR